jgi:hypothetical protein
MEGGAMHGFLMGGTGLEPVTPSLSIRGSVRVSSLRFAQTASLSENTSSTEHLSERERTLNLAILATPNAANMLVITAVTAADSGLDIGIADTVAPRPDRAESGLSISRAAERDLVQRRSD